MKAELRKDGRSWVRTELGILCRETQPEATQAGNEILTDARKILSIEGCKVRGTSQLQEQKPIGLQHQLHSHGLKRKHSVSCPESKKIPRRSAVSAQRSNLTYQQQHFITVNLQAHVVIRNGLVSNSTVGRPRLEWRVRLHMGRGDTGRQLSI